MNNKKYLIAGSALAGSGILSVYYFFRRTIPKGVTAVHDFNSRKYVGKWYEIARLDYYFERNLKNITAHYFLNDDGSIRVVNQGYNIETGNKKEVTGKAKLVNSPKEAKLKVSFFGPFYAGYNVIAIDPDYKYALVAGRNRKYLWLLSREKTMPESIKQKYLEKRKNTAFLLTI